MAILRAWLFQRLSFIKSIYPIQASTQTNTVDFIFESRI